MKQIYVLVRNRLLSFSPTPLHNAHQMAWSQKDFLNNMPEKVKGIRASSQGRGEQEEFKQCKTNSYMKYAKSP